MSSYFFIGTGDRGLGRLGPEVFPRLPVSQGPQFWASPHSQASGAGAHAPCLFCPRQCGSLSRGPQTGRSPRGLPGQPSPYKQGN